MLTVEQARERILSRIDPLAPVELPLDQARGAVAADDLIAPHPLPRFDNSAMDGYAVLRADVDGASEADPVTLRLIGEVRAGDPGALTVEPGCAARIMTGAPVPRGADAVVPIEVAQESGSAVVIEASPPSHGHIRPAGDDVSAGEAVVQTGSVLRSAELALLASLGLDPVRVRRGAVVAIVVTGDELVGPGEEPAPGQIRDSNTYALNALVAEAGATPVPISGVPDDLDSVVVALEKAAVEADLVVSAGGVSVGRYDYVKEAVERLGSIDLWRVAMQPGKPVVSGRVCDRPFLGLPGNPVSVHIGFEQFVRPVLRKMQGHRTLLRPVVPARLTEPLKKKPGRLHFVRVRVGIDERGFVATPLGKQGSHIQSSLISCDGVARFDIDESELQAGDEVQVELWRVPES